MVVKAAPDLSGVPEIGLCCCYIQLDGVKGDGYRPGGVQCLRCAGGGEWGEVPVAPSADVWNFGAAEGVAACIIVFAPYLPTYLPVGSKDVHGVDQPFLWCK